MTTEDKTTASQPSTESAPSSTTAATDTTTTTESTDQVLADDEADPYFDELAARSDARLQAQEREPAPSPEKNPPDKAGTESNTEAPAKAGASTSKPGEDAAASTDAAATDKGKENTAAAAQEPTDDEILASTPEKLRPAVERRLRAEKAAKEKAAELDRANKDLEQKYRSEQGRVAALTRAGKPAPAAKTAPLKPTAEELATVKADVEAFEKRYPDIAKGIKAIFVQRGGNLSNERELLEFVADQKVAAEKRIAYDAVEKAHPGWQDMAKSKEYSEWIATQPAKVQAWADSEDITDAVLLFDRFKARPGAVKNAPSPTDAKAEAAKKAAEAEAAALAAKRELQQDGARTATAKGGAAPDTTLDPNSLEALFDIYAKKADARLARLGT